VRLALIIALAVACGGKPTPKPPPALDAKQLAKLLDSDLATVGDIAQRQRGDCAATTAELRPHVERMKQHAAEVARMLEDPVKGPELKAEVAKYSETARNDRIANDLGATYKSCQNDAQQRHQLERVIADIPTF
jgi:hypothetical protein